MIEERILESEAWKDDAPLYNLIQADEQRTGPRRFRRHPIGRPMHPSDNVF